MKRTYVAPDVTKTEDTQLENVFACWNWGWPPKPNKPGKPGKPGQPGQPNIPTQPEEPTDPISSGSL